MLFLVVLVVFGGYCDDIPKRNYALIKEWMVGLIEEGYYIPVLDRFSEECGIVNYLRNVCGGGRWTKQTEVVKELIEGVVQRELTKKEKDIGSFIERICDKISETVCENIADNNVLWNSFYQCEGSADGTVNEFCFPGSLDMLLSKVSHEDVTLRFSKDLSQESEEHRCTKKIVEAHIIRNGYKEILKACDALRKDVHFIVGLLNLGEGYWNILGFVHPSIRCNRELVLASLEKNVHAGRYILKMCDVLLKNKEFIIEALRLIIKEHGKESARYFLNEIASRWINDPSVRFVVFGNEGLINIDVVAVGGCLVGIAVVCSFLYWFLYMRGKKETEKKKEKPIYTKKLRSHTRKQEQKNQEVEQMENDTVNSDVSTSANYVPNYVQNQPIPQNLIQGGDDTSARPNDQTQVIGQGGWRERGSVVEVMGLEDEANYEDENPVLTDENEGENEEKPVTKRKRIDSDFSDRKRKKQKK